MLKLLWLYSLFFSTQLYAYSLDQISLSDYEFRRYVRPQMRSIASDFQTLLFALNPELKNFKNDYISIKNIFEQTTEIQKHCTENFINDDCYKIITTINKSMKNLINSKYQASEVLLADIDERITHYNTFQKYQNLIVSLYVYTDHLIFQKHYLDFFVFDHSKLINQINELFSYFNLFILKSSFKPVRQEFTAYWISFIKPSFEFIIMKNQMEYFKNNVTKFNISWNILNVKLTKRNIPISKQVKTLLNVMHHRWNNILKVSLKTN